MDVYDKLTILTDAAKYDVACTSSGSQRAGKPGQLGSAVNAGICHSFAADGRCISLLKVLLTNHCEYDCKYCVNRKSNDTQRTAFTARELADLTYGFYRRNYIEGLFLSSGVMKSPDYTTERMMRVLQLLRGEYGFNGYIHVKAIPGTDPALLTRLGMLADRMSINIELPSQQSLGLLAPDKSKQAILQPMGLIREQIAQSTQEMVPYRQQARFVPAGQSTQMIVGATPDSDHQIITLAEGLYNKYRLKRVFYSAYMPVVSHALLPAQDVKPPLLREHRLYQADWLLRFYGFEAKELLDAAHPNFNLMVDPKCNWALNHPEFFPVEINRAPYLDLLRVPGIGVKSAQRIMAARLVSTLDYAALKKIGVVLKRAQYFITCGGRMAIGAHSAQDHMIGAMLSDTIKGMLPGQNQQLSMFGQPRLTREDVVQCISGQM